MSCSWPQPFQISGQLKRPRPRCPGPPFRSCSSRSPICSRALRTGGHPTAFALALLWSTKINSSIEHEENLTQKNVTPSPQILSTPLVQKSSQGHGSLRKGTSRLPNRPSPNTQLNCWIDRFSCGPAPLGERFQELSGQSSPPRSPPPRR